MNEEVVKKIIEAANRAPSGGNSQPWKFIVKSDAMDIIALPEKDHRVLNFKNRGTYIAHGALIENIDIASQALGYEARFDLFPRENISVSVSFTPSVNIGEVDLYDSISKRHSNRKPFAVASLAQGEKEYVFKEAKKFPSCELSIVEGKNISLVAESLAHDTTVNLQNKLLHQLLFQEIIWREEDQANRPGLYVKTMEVSGAKAFIFNLVKHWKVAKFFTRIGIPKKIHQENTKTMSSCALFGAITVKDNDIDFLEAGRLMENIWLRATKLGLGFHLVTGVLFFWQQANLGKREIFSVKEREIIDRAYKNLSNIFETNGKIIALTFRLGRADEPLAVSHKRAPEVEYK